MQDERARLADQTPSSRLWVLPSWLLNQVASYANRLVGAAFGRPGRRLHYAVLAGLDEFGPISQAALSRRLGVDGSDLVSALKDLETDHLVVRSPDALDRRRNAISITDAGLATLHELDAAVLSTAPELLAPLSTEEQAQFVSLLQRVLAHHSGWRLDEQ